MIIGVIGGASVSPQVHQQAFEIGRKIAEAGAILVCGGLGGVMEAACQGARSAGGITVGILPGSDTTDANPYVTIPVATGMGIARNAIVVRTAHVVIAVDGSYGTLSEIAIALNLGKTVVQLGSWRLPEAGEPAGDRERGVPLPSAGTARSEPLQPEQPAVDPRLYVAAKNPSDAVEKAIAIAKRGR